MRGTLRAQCDVARATYVEVRRRRCKAALITLGAWRRPSKLCAIVMSRSARQAHVIAALRAALCLISSHDDSSALRTKPQWPASDYLTTGTLMCDETRMAEVACAHGAFRREITEGDMVKASRATDAATGRERRKEDADVLCANIAITTSLTVVANHPCAESTNEVSGMSRRHRT